MALVGASGLVGGQVLKVLEEENLARSIDLTMYVAVADASKTAIFNGKTCKFKKLSKKTLKNFDIAIFSAGEEVSKVWAQEFVNRGAYVIDNSNAFRREKDIPLVVPEINASNINQNTKIIANPNCSTIELVVVLERLMRLSKVEKVVVSTYQSVSGAGIEALKDLKNNTKKIFKEGIKGNVIAQIGDLLKSGFCVEEDKLMFETQKILGKKLDICASVARVPVAVCHGESVYIKFAKKVDLQKIKKALACDYIKYGEDLFYPSLCAGTNLTYVFRLRAHSPNEIMMFILADNLRRGASFNAVKIAEYLIEKYLKN